MNCDGCGKQIHPEKAAWRCQICSERVLDFISRGIATITVEHRRLGNADAS